MTYSGWLKRHLFLTFLLFSLLAHFVAMGAVRIYHWRRNIISQKIIECDYYPLPHPHPQPVIKAPSQNLVKEDKIKEERLIPERLPSLPAEKPPGAVSPEEEEEIDFRAALEKLCPSSTPGREETLPDYVKRLRGVIDAQIDYPELALKMGLEGSVVVSFSLNRRGRLLCLIIPSGGESTFAPFNKEALRSVRQASRKFPEFPASMTNEVVHFRLPVAFEIKNEKNPSGFPLPRE